MNDYRTEAPEILREFLSYHENIKIHSPKTIDEYFLDLRTLFRFLKRERGLAPRNTPLEEISILDVDLEFIAAVNKVELTGFSSFLRRDRVLHPRDKNSKVGVNDKTLYRKMSVIRSFFKYLTVKTGKLKSNPVEDWDMPKRKGTLPKYLTLEESVRLLENVGGRHKARDYCILTIFLNCGLRISELVGLDLQDIRSDHLRVLGKGNKERIVYINDATADAINAYLLERPALGDNLKALFLSQQHQRISRSAVHLLVKKHIGEASLSEREYSSHKLRHTAATLMLKNGVDVRVLQELLGHEHLNTTQIYTHVENADLKSAAAAHPLAKVKN
ncbi:MAG: tyrosine-type recombinase/integrase [Oscillospiraceae bacterium]|jgi:site-specific recombinase XerD|nr:tyrosine-type recombinase/integrase [Oscillospiraceae bacterium]